MEYLVLGADDETEILDSLELFLGKEGIKTFTTRYNYRLNPLRYQFIQHIKEIFKTNLSAFSYFFQFLRIFYLSLSITFRIALPEWL